MKTWLERKLLGTGHCYRCDRPWITKAQRYLGYRDGSHHWRQLKHDRFYGLLGVREHITDVTDSSGMFPLCEGCWTELGSAEARRPYYRQLWEKWERSPEMTWPLIVQALAREEEEGGR